MTQINTYVATGGSCNALVSASNPNDPVANAGMNRTIPIVTAFQLEGSGSDVDGDTLSYQWDQMNLGTATTANTIGDDLGNNPLFRSYPPQASGDRDLPALGTQVRDGPYDQSEAMPCTTRTLNFRLTVRDGKSGQGSDVVLINVDGNSGPFRITSHNLPGTTIDEGSPSTILTWAVANTDLPPVSCPKIDIDLLTFDANHANYSELSLDKGIDNNGIATVLIGKGMAVHQSSSHARFRIKCSNNIFYDISDTDIDVQGSMGPFPANDHTTFFNANGLFATSNSSCVAARVSTGGGPVSTGGGGGGVFDELWMLFLGTLITSLKLFRGQQLILFRLNLVV
jgi:hypothetical protein